MKLLYIFLAILAFYRPIPRKVTIPILNIRNFGGLGNGISSLHQDSLALVRVVDSATRMRSHGNKCKIYIQHGPSYYAYQGSGLKLPDNVEVYGDGPISQIRNVNPDKGQGFNGVIFYTGYYQTNRLAQQPSSVSFPIKNAVIGSTYIILYDSSHRSALIDNKTIALAGRICYIQGDTTNPYWSEFEENTIISHHGDTANLKYSLTTNLNTSPVLIDLSDTINNTTNPLGHDFIGKQISIHDLKLTQAQTNEVTSTPLTRHPGAVIKGGGYECLYYHLNIEAFNSLPSGNGYNRCKFYEDTIKSCKKLFDFGQGSANSTFHDIVYDFKDSPAKSLDSDNAFAFLDQGTHGISIYNVRAEGDWNQNAFFNIANSTNHDTIKYVSFVFPAYNQPTTPAIRITDGNSNGLPVKHIFIDNMTLVVDSVSNFIRVSGDSILIDRNINITNCYLFGVSVNSPTQNGTFGTVNFMNVYQNSIQLF